MAMPESMMVPRKGMRVLVTGAAGSIGASLCARLTECGAAVVGLDVTASGGAEAAGVRMLTVDLADPDATGSAVAEAIATLGGLDAVVGAAAIVDTIHRAATFPTERWRRDIDANLSGQFYVLRAAHSALRDSEDGRAVLVSSMAGLDGLPGQAAYAASKGGVIGLARSLAAEWAEDGITVNTVVPGVFRTAKVAAMPATTSERILTRIPLGRYGEHGELTGMILFLLSPSGGYCHGGVYRVDGGIGLFTTGFYG